jgi:glutamate dehydrogenase
METHPLRRQIICTYVVNSMLDRMGPSFAFRMRDDTGEDAPAVARAYAVAREVFDAPQAWADIQALDNRVAAPLQLELLVETQQLLERATLWLLRNRRQPLAIDATVQQFREGMAAILTEPAALLAPSDRAGIEATAARYVEAGVPEALAVRIATFDWLYCALDIIEVAQQAQIPEPVVARVYFGIFNRLDLGWLRGMILAIPTTGSWQQRARAALLDGLYGQARALTAHALLHGEQGGAGAMDAWADANREGLTRYAATLAELRVVERPDLAMLSVALREIGSLMRTR